MLACKTVLPGFKSSGGAVGHQRPSRKHHSISAVQLLESRSTPVFPRVVLGFAAALVASTCGSASGAEITTKQQFTQSCAGCHANGGNIVQRNAGLSMEELKKNNVASSSQIYDLIYNGKGKMPGYGEGCTPKGKCTFAARLKDDQITALTDYVLQQAAEGWRG